jgi:hypothetical protein
MDIFGKLLVAWFSSPAKLVADRGITRRWPSGSWIEIVVFPRSAYEKVFPYNGCLGSMIVTWVSLSICGAVCCT